MKAWLEAWTSFDTQRGFTYQIAGEGGSEYLRNKVLRAVLKVEENAHRQGTMARAFFSSANYLFQPAGAASDGLLRLFVKPLRRDMNLVDGSIFLNPADAGLERVEGRLAKTPSIWIRRVDMVRRYHSFGGVRVPVEVESNAQVRMVGRSTFRMTYVYDMVNGQQLRSRDAARRQLTAAAH